MHAPWFAIQINPNAGSGSNAAVVTEFVDRVRSLGGEAQVFTDRAKLDAAVSARAAPGDSSGHQTYLIAGGGDGTVLDLVNRHPQIPVGVFPLGTENLLARYLGIPRNASQAAEIAMRRTPLVLDSALLQSTSDQQDRPPTRQVAARASDQQPRRFLIMASIGIDAAVVHEMHARRQGHIHRLSYLFPILRNIASYQTTRIRVWADDAQTPLEGGLVVVANLPAYALSLPVVPTAEGADGLLDVRIFPFPTTTSLFKLLWDIPWGWHENDPHVHKLRCQTLRIEADCPVPIQVDGDAAGFTPATITVQPGMLRILRP